MDKVRKLLLPAWRPLMRAARYYSEKQIHNLTHFPNVKIADGKFKYIMAQVYIHGEMATAKEVIRGSTSAKYHLDIYDELRKEAKKQDLCTQCTGGGFMVHDSEKKYMKIYGRSQVLGKADHEKSRDMLNEKYPNYKIDAESGGIQE